MTIVHNNKEHQSNCWYSQEDQDIFKQTLVQDVQDISRLLASNNVITNEEVLQSEYIIGIESYLNRELMRLVAAKKRAHVSLIVREQRHCNTEEELATISKISSRWASDGAQARARVFKSHD